MDLKRFWRHVAMTPGRARRAFPDQVMECIAAAISEGERNHRGELVFVVEAELSTVQLWRGLTARARALEVFASHGVWNTEENNGVLIYLLLADRRAEIVADRGIDSRVTKHEWSDAIALMDAEFHQGRYEAGALAGVRAVSLLLERSYPDQREGRNQIGDRPVLL